MTVPQAASEVDLPVSTVYRFIRELSRFGLVVEIGEGLYALGPRLVHLGGPATLYAQLRHVLHPVLHELSTETGETALATVRSGLMALTLIQVTSENPIHLSFQEGSVRPLYAGASATALFAYQPELLVRQVIREGLPPSLSEPQVRQRLELIRERGYSLSTGEVDRDATAIGVPVRIDGSAVCAISIAGPTSRLQPRLLELAPMVVEAGDRAERSLFDDTNWPTLSEISENGE